MRLSEDSFLVTVKGVMSKAGASADICVNQPSKMEVRIFGYSIEVQGICRSPSVI